LPRIRLWSRPALDVEDRLFRALAVLRVVLLVNAVALIIWRWDALDQPAAGVACIVVMVGWTVYVTYAYADPDRRRAWLLTADLAVAIGLLVASPLVKGEEFRATIPGFWVMAALLAWAIRYYWRGGLFAGACLVIADVSVRAELTQTTYGNAFLLLVGGPVVGFMSESLHLMAQERDAAQRRALAEAERARLARVVHDGVLQVLALVQRRGAEIGGEATELARLAGEQETALRTLIRSQDTLDPETAEGTLDLASHLGRLAQRPGVHVATPGTSVDLPAATVAELVAVVSACLDNVATHVGPDAPAWVLLEALDDRIVVAVRDEGPGIPEGRLEEAAAEGRLGVSESIRGRIADLGGTAELSTGSFGTEWEFVVGTR
jgi:signal transduction histidine kinase